MHHVLRAVKRLVNSNRKEDTATLKAIRTDVDKIKDFLRGAIGTTYNEATSPSDENLLSVDMSDWGGLRRQRTCAPFATIRRQQPHIEAYVRQQLAKLCPWHHWQ